MPSRHACPINNNQSKMNVFWPENVTGDYIPDSKVHGAHMGPIWGRQDPGVPHVGPMNFVIWDRLSLWQSSPTSATIRQSWWPYRFSVYISAVNLLHSQYISPKPRLTPYDTYIQHYLISSLHISCQTILRKQLTGQHKLQTVLFLNYSLTGICWIISSIITLLKWSCFSFFFYTSDIQSQIIQVYIFVETVFVHNG